MKTNLNWLDLIWSWIPKLFHQVTIMMMSMTIMCMMGSIMMISGNLPSLITFKPLLTVFKHNSNLLDNSISAYKFAVLNEWLTQPWSRLEWSRVHWRLNSQDDSCEMMISIANRHHRLKLWQPFLRSSESSRFISLKTSLIAKRSHCFDFNSNIYNPRIDLWNLHSHNNSLLIIVKTIVNRARQAINKTKDTLCRAGSLNCQQTFDNDSSLNNH